MKTVQTFLKSSIKILLLIFLSVITLLCSAQENVKSLTFYSKSLKEERKVEVYLPEDYNQNKAVRYPVIYFLHGAGQNSFSEGNLLYIAKKLIINKTISPVIIVKPDGSCPTWESSYFMNSALNGNFEDYLVNDLVEYIDSAFRTIDSRNKRTIMGWSAGGSCAIRTALKHPDKYRGVVSHSGRPNMSSYSLLIPGILSENGGAPVTFFNPNAGPMSKGVFTMAAAFSPNLNNTPYFVDFPFDGNGNFIDSVWNRWLLNDCSFLAKNISKEDDLAIYFDCGTNDETMAYPFNTSFADSLNILELPYNFQSFSGGHYDRAGRYPIGLTFLDSVLNRAEGSKETGKWTFKTPMPTGRGFTSGAVVDGKIYMIGGFPTHTSVTQANEMYDPVTDSWTKKADMPIGRCAHATCTYNGKIYVFGGVSSNPYGPATNAVLAYNPQTDSWTQMANMPYENAFCGIAVVNDTIYLIGGMKSYASPTVSTVWAYNPLTDLWTEKAPMPTARGMFSACALNGKIYAIGGTVNFLTSSFDIVEVYDPETNTWTTETPMPISRVSLATCVLNDKIYAVGGYDYPLMYALNETYNPELHEWTTKAPMQETRQTFFLGAVGDKIYAIGGSYPNPNNPAMPVILNSVEEYSTLATGSIENRFGEQGLPNQLKLGQNYPNPFNSTTIIQYELFHQMQVKLSVYNLSGHEVETPVNQKQPAGIYQVIFSGDKLAGGIYFYKIQAKFEKGFYYTETRKLTLIK